MFSSWPALPIVIVLVVGIAGRLCQTPGGRRFTETPYNFDHEQEHEHDYEEEEKLASQTGGGGVKGFA